MLARGAALSSGMLAGDALIDSIAAAGLGLGEVFHLSSDARDLFLIDEIATVGGDDADRDAHQIEAPQDAVAVGGRKVAAPPVVPVVDLEYLVIERGDQRTTDRVDAVGRGQDGEVVAADVTDEV